MRTSSACLLIAAVATAHAATGTLKGDVTSNLGPPVTSGTVTIEVNGVPVAPASIDAAGHYQTVVSWAGAAGANCHLRASAPQFLDASSDITLQPSGTATVDFVLIEDIFNDGFEMP